jgi:cysteine desulfurase / selenocysteine lyase
MNSRAQEFDAIRKLFPMVHRRVHSKPFVYLDNAATTLKPQSVINTLTTFYKSGYGTVHRAIYNTAILATEAFELTRKKAQHFLNAADVSEIIFVKGATEAINLVAYSFGEAFINPGDSIIISEAEHHSNIIPWQECAKRHQAKLLVIPVLDDGTLDFDAFLKLLDNKTKIVAITHVSNTLGLINPIEKIVEAAHSYGARVLVDGAQAVCHMQVDVQALGCDFYLFSSHKMYGPTGLGILYGKKELLEEMPPYQTGGDMIEEVTFERTTFTGLPQKFEAGTPNISAVIGLGAAFDFLHEIGLEKIALWEQELLKELWRELQHVPEIEILGGAENRISLVTFTIKGVHPLDLATLLDLHAIAIRSGHLCAQPTLRRFGKTSANRASLSMYNTKEEIAFFVEKLCHAIEELR